MYEAGGCAGNSSMFMLETFLEQFVFIWGHVNNAPKHLTNFPLGSIII
jgi:hypothetical protein